MLKWIGVTSLVVMALALGACAPKSQDSCGFVQNSYGERVSWKAEVPVTMYLHTSVPEEYVGAIVSAAQTWEKSAGRKLFNIVTTPRVSGPNSPRQDGKNVIYFMDTWETERGSEQARTSVLWRGDQINETDIRVNTKDFTFYWNQSKSGSSVNIEALILHEMGHVLGLKHNDDKAASSVMQTYLRSGDDRTEPSATDTTDLKCEY
ncbi:matrixin family metalloprotease [Bdellovibrio sp. SKB1291214]|uniref:matrixin family metalloprotease n=1 Tax=Bdellovibrio sp. SKB1291214 TaxID=1732569 RepID=UPI000B51A71C|nr:matrixin family metalloprotease [Bdellovibrio sp. SKB1291214]UYL09563.1 matrixin family metalloprotease [Bdellovibrio sp. SKB1291214]